MQDWLKTRYGMVANPFAEGTSQGEGALSCLTVTTTCKVANLM